MSQNLRITNHDSEWNPKYFGIICGLFCGLYMICQALGSKIIDVYGFVLPAGIIVFPLCCIITDLLTEVYGFNRTRQAVYTVLLCTLLFALFTQAGIALKPASFWTHQEAFATILGVGWRTALGGALAWVAGELINTYVMSKMKIFQHAKFMGTRFLASTVVGQFFDTFIFVVIVFAGTMETGDLIKIILTGWLFKVLYEVAALPFSIAIAKKLKRLEGVEHFDRQKISLI